MSNYLVTSKYYNTGFIPPTAAALRIKQGLEPQDISNACAYTPPSFSATGKNTGASCNPGAMYPAKQTKLSYGLPQIPDNCPCLDYIKAP
jgi:hypothetical protein